ncbi:hypothetical protein BDN67DRAFT_985605 [Paxillus ammoniavirescens]|nr:hypothetical protein BDN67DRAFT_985605 [Paxillus ammoniavirescens]
MKYWMGDGYTAEGVDYSWTQPRPWYPTSKKGESIIQNLWLAFRLASSQLTSWNDQIVQCHPWLGSWGLEKAAPQCRHANFYEATLTKETLAWFRALIHWLPSHGTAIDFTLSPV